MSSREIKKGRRDDAVVAPITVASVLADKFMMFKYTYIGGENDQS
jgi:hypothetical protein